MLEAYSQEVSSAGCWPGGGGHGRSSTRTPIPEPEGFAAEAVRAGGGPLRRRPREFVLPYEAAAAASDPDASVAEFLDSTFAAAATRGRWDQDSPPGA